MSAGFVAVPERLEGEGVMRHSGRFGASTLRVTYRVDTAEHARRAREGVGAIDDLRLLDVLLLLPEDVLAPLPERFANTLGAAPAGATATVVDPESRQRWASRRLRCPVQVLELEVTASSWRAGSARLHPWVGYGARNLQLELDDPQRRGEVLAEASYYGIGVTVGEDTLVTPAPYRPRRWTAARWRFAETVYGQWAAIRDS